MILVTGAGGKTGRAVVNALALKRETVRVFVRSASHAEALAALGAAEAQVADLRDEAAVARAMEGVRAVYHICPNVSPEEVSIGQIAIRAAVQAEVGQFVYHSVLHSQTEAMPHHWSKMRVEELLYASGLPFTILQPTAYMQNILSGWDSILNAGKYRVPYPASTRLSLVDLDDVADAAANVLTELGHMRAVYELVGTRGLAQSEVAEILSAHLGRAVTAEEAPLAEWEAEARAAGMGEQQVSALLAMFRYYAAHGMWGNSNVLGWLLHRTPKSFPEFVKRVLRSGV